MWNPPDGFPQSRQGHGATSSSQYPSTASSAPKTVDTSTKAGFHVNRSWNSTSGPVSFNREKAIPNCPEVVVQRDASTDKTALHFRSIFGGCISENRTSLNAKAGLHVRWPAACVTPISPMLPASMPNMNDRYMCCFSFRFEL
jgi:hypothetical protein